MAKVQDSNLRLSEVELHSCYKVHFNNNPFIHSSYRLKLSLLLFYKDGFGIR